MFTHNNPLITGDRSLITRVCHFMHWKSSKYACKYALKNTKYAEKNQGMYQKQWLSSIEQLPRPASVIIIQQGCNRTYWAAEVSACRGQQDALTRSFVGDCVENASNQINIFYATEVIGKYAKEKVPGSLDQWFSTISTPSSTMIWATKSIFSSLDARASFIALGVIRTCTSCRASNFDFVFLRSDSARTRLRRPFTGPCRILDRDECAVRVAIRRVEPEKADFGTGTFDSPKRGGPPEVMAWMPARGASLVYLYIFLGMMRQNKIVLLPGP